LKVQYKLFSITLIASLFLVVLMTGLAQWSLDQGLLAHVNKRAYQQYGKLIDPLVEIHKRYGSLSILNKQPQLWAGIKEQANISGPSNDGPLHKRGFERPPTQRHMQNDDRHRQHRPRNDKGDHPEFRRPEPGFRFREPPPRANNNTNEFAPPRNKKSALSTTEPNLNRPPMGFPLAVYDESMRHIIGQRAKEEHQKKIPVMVLGDIKGYIVYADRERLIDDYDLDISKEITQYLWWIAGIMVLLSASLAMPFSRLLIKPIRPIVEALHQLANGQLDARVDIKGKDEIAQVADDVNNLANTLAQNEDIRKKWLANISHELRTPLAVMRGELEAMIDGVREVDIEHIKSSHQEALHLQRLVEDLYQLTSSDIGALSFHKAQLGLIDFLEDEIERLEPLIKKSGHELEFIHSIPSNEEAWVNADGQRLSQLVHNLIQNSVKYTHSPGKIKVSLLRFDTHFQIKIEDTAPSVKTEELEKIFDHLYRAERSRNRSTGGSGLGLAICKKIIEGHSGTLTAQHSEMGGITMILTIPILINA
jgi:two-component system sensor histidine kinase BaeS